MKLGEGTFMNLFSQKKELSRKVRDTKHFAHWHNKMKLQSLKLPVYSNRPQHNKATAWKQPAHNSHITESYGARYTEIWFLLPSQLALLEPSINMAKATAVPKKNMTSVHGQPSHKSIQV